MKYVKNAPSGRLLLEPRDKGADEPHAPDIVGKGHFLHDAATGPVLPVLIASGMDQVRLAGLDPDDREMGHDLINHALLRVLDPVDDVAVLELPLERLRRQDIFRQDVNYVFAA